MSNEMMVIGFEFSSLQISEWTGKEHGHVMRDVRNETEELGEIAESIFGLGSYIDKQNQSRPCFRMNEDGVQQLTLKYELLKEVCNMSNEMIVVNYNNDRITTSARNLWEGLDRPYSEFMKWFDTYKAFGFEEGEDYKVIEQLLGNPNGGRPAQDYEITLDMAKQLAMLQKSEKGRIYRQYFLDLEKKWNSPEYVMKRALEMANRKCIELEQESKQQKVVIEEQKEVILLKDQKLVEAKTVIDTIVDEWVKLKDRTVFNALLRWLGQKAGNTSEDYRTVYNEFYNELSLICGIKISIREKNYKKKHNVNKISKIELIKNKEWEKVIRCLAGWYLLKGGSLSYLHSLIKKDSDIEL